MLFGRDTLHNNITQLRRGELVISCSRMSQWESPSFSINDWSLTLYRQTFADNGWNCTTPLVPRLPHQRREYQQYKSKFCGRCDKSLSERHQRVPLQWCVRRGIRDKVDSSVCPPNYYAFRRRSNNHFQLSRALRWHPAPSEEPSPTLHPQPGSHRPPEWLSWHSFIDGHLLFQ